MPKPRNLDSVIRCRVEGGLTKRVAKIANKRGCDTSDVAREAIMIFTDSEEVRLGLGKPRPAKP